MLGYSPILLDYSVQLDVESDRGDIEFLDRDLTKKLSLKTLIIFTLSCFSFTV